MRKMSRVRPSNLDNRRVPLNVAATHLNGARGHVLTHSRIVSFWFEELVFRMLLYHGGKLVKRKKTTPRVVGTMSPNFEDSLTFDLPQAEIDNVTFIVVLCASSLVSET